MLAEHITQAKFFSRETHASAEIENTNSLCACMSIMLPSHNQCNLPPSCANTNCHRPQLEACTAHALPSTHIYLHCCLQGYAWDACVPSRAGDGAGQILLGMERSALEETYNLQA